MAAALRIDGHLNRWFLDPLLRGALPGRHARAVRVALRRRSTRCATATCGDRARPIDFLGVNYYNPQRSRPTPARGPLGLRPRRAGAAVTAMGWEVDAGGLHEMLVRAARATTATLPIYITENGAAFDDPP